MGLSIGNSECLGIFRSLSRLENTNAVNRIAVRETEGLVLSCAKMPSTVHHWQVPARPSWRKKIAVRRPTAERFGTHRNPHRLWLM